VPKKRKSQGRRKGGKGKGTMVQCAYCGKSVPRDKAKKVYRRSSFVDPRLAHELRQKGTYIPSSQQVQFACINCAVHRGLYSPRQANQRRKPFQKRRR